MNRPRVCGRRLCIRRFLIRIIHHIVRCIRILLVVLLRILCRRHLRLLRHLRIMMYIRCNTRILRIRMMRLPRVRPIRRFFV